MSSDSNSRTRAGLISALIHASAAEKKTSGIHHITGEYISWPLAKAEFFEVTSAWILRLTLKITQKSPKMQCLALTSLVQKKNNTASSPSLQHFCERSQTELRSTRSGPGSSRVNQSHLAAKHTDRQHVFLFQPLLVSSNTFSQTMTHKALLPEK